MSQSSLKVDKKAISIPNEDIVSPRRRVNHISLRKEDCCGRLTVETRTPVPVISAQTIGDHTRKESKRNKDVITRKLSLNLLSLTGSTG